MKIYRIVSRITGEIVEETDSYTTREEAIADKCALGLRSVEIVAMTSPYAMALRGDLT